MKKLIGLFAVLAMSLSNTTVLSADEMDLDSKYIDDTQYLANDESMFAFYSKLDDKTYIVDVHESYVNILDDSKNIINTMYIYKGEPSIINIELDNFVSLYSSPDDYEKWGNWSYYKRDSLRFSDIESWTISTIVGALKELLENF